MVDDKDFYIVYSFGDRLEPGDRLNIEHHISFNQNKANLSKLVSLTPDELKGMKLVSEEKEKQIFGKLCSSVEEWEQQAAQTLMLNKAIEYVRTPTVKHTSNQWQTDEYGYSEISNLVYKMAYRIQEDTKYDHALKKTVPVAWYVTWNVSFNAPPRGGYYGNSARSIAQQDKKRYSDKAAAEKYMQGRIAVYANLFTELSPPIPENKKNLFSVNGHLLPGYTLQAHVPTEQELLAFIEDGDVSPATEKALTGKKSECRESDKKQQVKSTKREVLER